MYDILSMYKWVDGRGVVHLAVQINWTKMQYNAMQTENT